MRFTFTETVGHVLANVEPAHPAIPEIQSQQLHRWIGESYMGATGRLRGSGNPIEYAEKDIRRAIAYLRLRDLIGAGIGADAQEMRERVRDVASWHTDGWVVVTDDEPKVTWTEDAEDALATIFGGSAVTIIPCAIREPFVQL